LGGKPYPNLPAIPVEQQANNINVRKTMRSISLVVALFQFSLTCLPVQGQAIRYETSLDEAKKQAEKQQRPLAILITIQPPAGTAHFGKGLDEASVIEKFNSSFINYKVAREDTALSAPLIRDYQIYRYPSYLFLDSKGAILFNDIAFVSIADRLLLTADKAIAASKEKSLADYDREYKADSSSTGFLKSYIKRRIAAGITDNADLVEKYVATLSVQDLNNYAEVLFILKAGPLVDGTAYRLAHTNGKLIDSVYRGEPFAARVAMNNAMINNTLSSAIAHKNYARANAAANFTRSSWTSNPQEGQKNWYLKMLTYYKGVNDTLNFLQMASTFYEQYYMRVSVDSIRRQDSLRFETARKNAEESSRPASTDTMARGITAVKRTVSFIYPKDNMFAADLNNAAWTFYLMAGNREDYLLKAMLWSKRSLELGPKPAFYDTYAHLLYKLKFFDEAESMERKAIAAAKIEKMDSRNFEQEYQKIRAKTLP